jgi:hypothetical protein
MSNVPPKFPKGLNVALQEASPSVVNGNMYYDTTLNRFIAREGGTTKDVIAPTDYVSIQTATTYTSGTTVDIWYIPTTAFTIQLTAGTWDIEAIIVSNMMPSAGTMLPLIALSTNSVTPGNDRVQTVVASTGATTAGFGRKSIAIIKLHNYVVGSTTDFYIHTQGLNIGSGVISAFEYGSFFGAHSILTAKRVKYA